MRKMMAIVTTLSTVLAQTAAPQQANPQDLVYAHQQAFGANRMTQAGENLEEAIGIFKKCIPTFAKYELPEAYTQCYVDMGFCYLKLENYELAKANFSHAYESSQRIKDNSWVSKGQWVSKHMITIAREQDDPEAVLLWTRNILKAEKRRSPKNRALLGNAHVSVADVLDTMGRRDEALLELQEALDVWRRPGVGNYLDILVRVAFAHSAAGRLTEARSRLVECLDLLDDVGLGSVDTKARAMDVLSDIQLRLGNPLAAMRLRQAMRAQRLIHKPTIAEQIPETRRLAETYLALGRSKEAETLLTSAYAQFESLEKQPTMEHAALLAARASMQIQLGQLENAETSARAGVALLKEAESAPSLTDVQLHRLMAEALARSGQREEARDAMKRHDAVFGRLDTDDRFAQVEHLSHRADLLDWIGDADTALTVSAEAMSIARRWKIDNAWRVSLNHIARQLARIPSDGDKAYADVRRELRSIIKETEQERLDAAGLEGRDRGYYLGRVRSDDPYAMLAASQRRSGQDFEALGTLEAGRGRVALDLMQSAEVNVVALATKLERKAPDEASALLETDNVVRERVNEVGQAHLAADRSPLPKTKTALVAAELDYRDIARERAALLAKYPSLVKAAQPITGERAAARLKKDEALLFYEIDPYECSVTVLAGKRNCKVYPLGDSGFETYNQITSGVADLLGPYQGRVDDRTDDLVTHRAGRGVTVVYSPDQETASERAERVFSLLMPREVWDTIRDRRRVYIIPDSVLSGLPFEMLVSPRCVDDDHGDAPSATHRTWLEAGPPIIYAPSLTVLDRCRGRLSDVRKKHDVDLLVVADPISNAPGRSSALDLRRLPGTMLEARSIYQQMTGRPFASRNDEPQSDTSTKEPDPSIQILMGLDAREPAVYAAAPSARILHFATHHIEDQSPWASRSMLLLTEPDEPAAGDDGAISLIDLLEKWRGRLAGSELVILSACATGWGDDLGPEGNLAMPVGFLAAGAPAVISTHWSVDDRSAAEIMQEFHAQLMKPNMSPATALAQAKLEIRKRRPDPYHWAPYVLIGDSR